MTVEQLENKLKSLKDGRIYCYRNTLYRFYRLNASDDQKIEVANQVLKRPYFSIFETCQEHNIWKSNKCPYAN